MRRPRKADSPNSSTVAIVRSARHPGKQRQAFIHRCHFLVRQFTKKAPNPPLVYRPRVIDKSVRRFGQTAWPGREGGIKQSRACRSGHRYYTHKREPLITDDFRIADTLRRPYTALFVPNAGSSSMRTKDPLRRFRPLPSWLHLACLYLVCLYLVCLSRDQPSRATHRK